MRPSAGLRTNREGIYQPYKPEWSDSSIPKEQSTTIRHQGHPHRDYLEHMKMKARTLSQDNKSNQHQAPPIMQTSQHAEPLKRKMTQIQMRQNSPIHFRSLRRRSTCPPRRVSDVSDREHQNNARAQKKLTVSSLPRSFFELVFSRPRPELGAHADPSRILSIFRVPLRR